MNLIGNAVKFSKDGIIMVNSKLMERKLDKLVVYTEVIDHGIYIEKAQKLIIFEPFK